MKSKEEMEEIKKEDGEEMERAGGKDEVGRGIKPDTVEEIGGKPSFSAPG